VPSSVGTITPVSRRAGFPEVADALLTLPMGTALDGELVILDAEGRPQFERLARAWAATERTARMAARRSPAALMAFDISCDAGDDVRDEPSARHHDFHDMVRPSLRAGRRAPD
jgi:bifunctional non-homologous end joining protein LigD